MITADLLCSPGEELSAVREIITSSFPDRTPRVAYYSGATVDTGRAAGFLEYTCMCLRECASILPIDLEAPERNRIAEILGESDVILIPGGNTYVLMCRMRDIGLADLLIPAVERGVHYIGFSAGAAAAGRNISLSNDRNIAGLTCLDGLGLIDACLHMHVADDDESLAAETYLVASFHRFNRCPVLSFGETGHIRIEGRTARHVSGNLWLGFPGGALQETPPGTIRGIGRKTN